MAGRIEGSTFYIVNMFFSVLFNEKKVFFTKEKLVTAQNSETREFLAP